MASRYPEIGQTVTIVGEGPAPYTVKGVTDRGDVIVRGKRLDDLRQVPLEVVRYAVERTEH